MELQGQRGTIVYAHHRTSEMRIDNSSEDGGDAMRACAGVCAADLLEAPRRHGLAAHNTTSEGKEGARAAVRCEQRSAAAAAAAAHLRTLPPLLRCPPPLSLLLTQRIFVIDALDAE